MLKMNEKILYKDEFYSIQGAIFEVHNVMGSGFLEAVYQECLEKEFSLRSIPFESQKGLALTYKGDPLKQKYIPDFICHGKIIVELKASKNLTEEHRAQVINYLQATGYELGLLVNFSSYPKVAITRILNTEIPINHSCGSCYSDAKNEFTTT
jgi:GxxExxY protein